MRRLHIFTILLLSCLSLNAQISVSESFTSSTKPSGWSTNLSHSTSSNYNCNNSGAFYKNLYGSYNTSGYMETSDLGSQTSGSTINVSYNFSVKEYSSYTATPAGEFTITGEYSTDGGSTWTTVSGSSINGTNYTPTTSCTTGSFSFNSPNTSSLKIKITCDLNSGDFYFSINDFTITESIPCSGTPVPGNTVAEVSSSTVSTVCSGTTVDFSLDGTIGTGATYQWESSTDGTNYSAISGATSTTYSGAVSADTYYRCAVTCSGNTGYSTAKQITLNSAPTTQGSSLTFASTYNSVTPSWTAASDADGYLVVYHTSALTAGPVDGTDYSVGDAVGGGNVGYIGTSVTGAVSSLTSNTEYTFTVYSYNESDDGCKVFNTTSALSAAQYTTPGVISSPSFSNETTSGFDLSWSAPTNGATSYLYTVFSDYYSTAVSSSYENVATTSTSITVTGLSAATTYYVRVWAVGSGGTGNSYNAGTVTTDCAVITAPMTQDFGTGGSFLICWEKYSGAIASSSTLTSTTSGWTMEYSSSIRPDDFSGSFKEITAFGFDGPFWLVSESIDL